MSTFSVMFIRALKVCDPEFLSENSKIVYDIARKPSLQGKLVKHCIKSERKTYYGDVSEEKTLLFYPIIRNLYPGLIF